MGAIKELYGTMPNGAKQLAQDMASHNQRKPEARPATAPAPVVAEIPADPCVCGHGQDMHPDYGTHHGACGHPLCNCMNFQDGGL